MKSRKARRTIQTLTNLPSSARRIPYIRVTSLRAQTRPLIKIQLKHDLCPRRPKMQKLGRICKSNWRLTSTRRLRVKKSFKISSVSAKRERMRSTTWTSKCLIISMSDYVIDRFAFTPSSTKNSTLWTLSQLDVPCTALIQPIDLSLR